MKSVKQLPLLAGVAGMVLVAISPREDWIRIGAVIVAIALLIIFFKDNLKKN
ncbi:hypothetical protein [Bdellovibrio sp. HCB337]|uniref:hypothetical protein n=1 Tax=Bdellovibrio sp. HCB337 TaxID=3394358 RepID=UPI0039A55A7B